ncbi:hypothetical protein HZB69_01085 [Candidatus Amesbacteria bacterium]|nr:hypothetical protein [Candidatus Amesbacteria bacterium]
MNRYLNLGGDSNISAYELGSDYIKVQFNDGSVYLYTYSSAGQQDVNKMKELAIQGQGLNSFINKYVRKEYASKE